MTASNRSQMIPKVKLGTQGLEVSKLGFGCAGLSLNYCNNLISEEAGIAIIKDAFGKGVTFFDTSNSYGENELLVGKALKQLPRGKVQLGTKFGVQGIGPNGMIVNGKPEYVRECCEASLQRLGVDYIDLYYVHRIDKTVPIEDTVSEMAKLVKEGKVKYIGLSEASPNTIRRAHAVHPLTAVQMEWSLWSRDIEEEIVPLCRELGIGIVPYSPLGRGFFGGKGVVETIPANTMMATHPRFNSENLEKNKSLYARVNNLALKLNCSPPQLALAWILHQGSDVVPIPGTTKIKNLDINIGSVCVKLTEEELKEISHIASMEEVAGPRSYGFSQPHDWKFADTPLLRATVA